MLVPSRGRPDSVSRMAAAWEMTGGVNDADLIWLIDQDDPEWPRYTRQLSRYPWMRWVVSPTWQPMVPKLNRGAQLAVQDYDMLGFMGDDHLPRSYGWAASLAAAHVVHGPGIYYGRDGYKDITLPTWWAMSSEVVRALGRMVPGDVEHLYCDNIVLEVGKAGRCLHFLHTVFIEHMHPVAGKAEWDAGHKHVNRPEQYEKDRRAYLAWLDADRARHGTILRELRGV